jgi:hypothetical protein
MFVIERSNMCYISSPKKFIDNNSVKHIKIKERNLLCVSVYRKLVCNLILQLNVYGNIFKEFYDIIEKKHLYKVFDSLNT